MTPKELEDKMIKHIETTNSEMGSVKTDVKWLIRGYWVLVSIEGAALVALISGLIKIFSQGNV